ncbi:MAG: hypothetical protein HDS31_01785 [Bacteroides sp.]|nr:hypothetical protein [Bacteroides sp.]
MKAKVKASGDIIEVKEWRGSSDVVYSTPDMNMFYASDEVEILSEKSEEAVLEGWVARDKSGYLVLHYQKPHRTLGGDKWYSGLSQKSLPKDSFPEVTWDTEPKRVKITITPIEE